MRSVWSGVFQGLEGGGGVPLLPRGHLQELDRPWRLPRVPSQRPHRHRELQHSCLRVRGEGPRIQGLWYNPVQFLPSGLTPHPRVLEQAMFYGVDGECLACPGISTSRKNSITIANCSCPVSPSAPARPYGSYGPIVIRCNYHELRPLLITSSATIPVSACAGSICDSSSLYTLRQDPRTVPALALMEFDKLYPPRSSRLGTLEKTESVSRALLVISRKGRRVIALQL